MPSRTIAIVATQGVQLLDVSGPLDVFAEANAQSGTEAYRLQVIGVRRGAIESSSRVRLLPDLVIENDPHGRGLPRVHTLLVAGAPHIASAPPDAMLGGWLRNVVPHVRRFGSVCSGAFILAEAGLLSGKRITTHWAVAAELGQRHPDLTIDVDAIHVRDGKLRTAAGVTAGLDLALSLVEEDLGREIAMRVASQLVMYFKRPGGQAQFSRRAAPAAENRSALQELQRWVAAHPAAKHDVPALAARIGVSARHLTRLFREEIGITPASWVEAARVSAARQLLEQGHLAPKQVAAECGFSSVDTLRRAFLRVVGVTPADYRKRHAVGDV
ncbi:GlxA family transcriptional regulator [Cupriavidus plantarum]|uniref:GlxA family transcriptional regulator n=1 Tax=Cupriavidus plantarum TaxID=942865 RepID=UPI000E221DE0|nr:helix-turn-helix domain-containing protein [Cupriavidus plantarum]NYI00896.1 transcriptional regulator GlxA family with amidase domain [Cupriavidus plantarum]REE93752.1 AraC family transcriptional regulator with amidase-like domain [Cupriavidus plantarum]CAG2134966.1 HTH-type transcriptional regulator CdhR [Cupriavidus plantarum]SMR84496.1 transcriptional regulator, AraC family with amidase-like domain [Cupriavidus plantarum]